MKLFWLLLLVILAISSAIADEVAFKNFVLKHQKQYKDKNEEALRQSIFQENLQKIEEHNKKFQQGLVTYKLGVNQFADLTNEEFSAMFKTLPLDSSKLKTTNKGVNVPAGAEIPQEIDWREKGVVSEVKNQGSCGGCWAFSTTGVVESHWAIKTGQLWSLSEQQLIDCDTTHNLGCNGGAVQYAINDYVDKYGLTSEANYSYVGYQRNKCQLPNGEKAIVKTKGFQEIMSGNETDLKVAVGLVGPVSIAMNSEHLKLYEGGIIYVSSCSQSVDHGVLAVGYGVATNTSYPNYWIMKNSWGEDWGENGYFRLAMGYNLCGITVQSCYPTDVVNSGFSYLNGKVNITLVLIFLTVNLFFLK